MEKTKNFLIGLYTSMYKIRYFEQEVVELYRNKELPGWLHSYIGEEAVAVGVCASLNRDDYITSTHRGHWEGDPEVYRTKEEVKEWKKRDPLKKFKKYLLENDITQSKEISFVEKKIEDEIKDAVKYAQASPPPRPESALEDLYVEQGG